VFIGCPIKMVFRLAAGDLTALIGVGGLVAGVYVGMKFLERGFTIGRPAPSPAANALLIPVLMALLLTAILLKPDFIAISTKGTGAQYAPLFLSLFAGLVGRWPREQVSASPARSQGSSWGQEFTLPETTGWDRHDLFFLSTPAGL
jgi:YedE family putative selenium metabolism protein